MDHGSTGGDASSEPAWQSVAHTPIYHIHHDNSMTLRLELDLPRWVAAVAHRSNANARRRITPGARMVRLLASSGALPGPTLELGPGSASARTEVCTGSPEQGLRNTATPPPEQVAAITPMASLPHPALVVPTLSAHGAHDSAFNPPPPGLACRHYWTRTIQEMDR